MKKHTTYSYILAPDGTFTVLATLPAHSEYPEITRPVGAYLTEKGAEKYCALHNAHAEARANGVRLPAPRTNMPIEYRFRVPEWWEELHPNWRKGE